MSASFSPSPAETSHILLVEPYDALATAIAATLRRSVPGCRISIASSLAQAELAWAECTIDLLVIDSDPPFAGVLTFFAKAKAAQPKMRVLIVISEAARESIDRAFSAAFHFIAKPFAIDDFGVAVQALLRGVHPSGVLPSAGTLRELRLPDIIRLHAWSGATAIVEVERGSGSPGEIHFLRGKLVQAAAQAAEGVEAVRAMLRWKSSEFFEKQSSDSPPRSTIPILWPELLQEAAALAKPSSSATMEEFVERISRETDEFTLGATPEARSAPVPSAWPRPTEERATNGHAAVAASVILHSSPEAERMVQPPPELLLLPALVPPAVGRNVWAALTLDVMALRLSSTLRVDGIHARVAGGTVSLHAEPGFTVPHAVFTFDGVDIDADGGTQIMRLAPVLQQTASPEISSGVPADFISGPHDGRTTIQLAPGAAAPAKMLLLVPCEVVAVELSATFSLARLVLMWRGGSVRVTPNMAAPNSGVSFRISHVTRNISSAAAEMMLEADA